MIEVPKKITRQPKKALGFGLLEALIAMAIAAVSLESLYRLVGQSAKSSVDAGLRVEAAILARSVMSSRLFAEDFQTNGDQTVGAWRWRALVVPGRVGLHIEADTAEVRQLDVAQIMLEVFLRDEVRPYYSIKVWKPYRSRS